MKSISAKGDVTIASDRIAVEQLMATLDHEKLEGQLAYNWPTDKHPARLDAQLRAGDLNLDALSTFAKAAVGEDGFALPQEAVIALDIGKATLAGVDAQAVKAHANLNAGSLQIDQLSIGNLAGAKLDASGKIDELSSQPHGQVKLDLDARDLNGLGDIAAKFAPRAADALRRAADRMVPAKVNAILTVQRAPSSGSTAQLQVTGDLAAMRLTASGVVTGEPSQLDAANVNIDGKLNAADGSALVALLGLDRVLGVDQLPGSLIVSAAGPLTGDIRVDANLAASGLGSAMQGTLRLAGDAVPWAKLKLHATAGDLRPLHQAMTGQPGAAVPVSADATLALDGANLSFTDVAATVGKSKVHGAIALGLDKSPISIDGNIEADEIDGASVLATLLGLPSNLNGGAAASSDKIGAGAFTAMNGGVTFKLARVVFTPALVARDLAGAVHFHPAMVAFDDINGSLGGGRITSTMAFSRNPDGVTAHGKIELVDAAAMIAGPSLNATDGQLTLTLEGHGFGAESVRPHRLLGWQRHVGAQKHSDRRTRPGSVRCRYAGCRPERPRRRRQGPGRDKCRAGEGPSHRARRQRADRHRVRHAQSQGRDAGCSGRQQACAQRRHRSQQRRHQCADDTFRIAAAERAAFHAAGAFRQHQRSVRGAAADARHDRADEFAHPARRRTAEPPHPIDRVQPIRWHDGSRHPSGFSGCTRRTAWRARRLCSAAEPAGRACSGNARGGAAAANRSTRIA